LKNILLLILFIALPLLSFTQGFGEDKKPNVFDKINISGEYRFFIQNRTFVDPYIIGVSNGDTLLLNQREILIGDATQLPELTLRISANPNSNVSFGTDLTFWNQQTGGFEYFRGMNLGVNLYGSFKTDVGSFNVKTGGIHWLKLSRMTLKQFEGFNRYNLFVRNPWDPQSNNIMGRYADYYDRGSIVQDVRWGNQAFQGFALDGAELPAGFNFTFLYGKAQTSASSFEEINSDNYQQSLQFANTQFYASLLPSYILGGRLSKTIYDWNLGLNSLNGYSYRDSLGLQTNNYQVHSIDYDFNSNGFSFVGELGLGTYNDFDPGLAIITKLKTPKKYTYLPLDIEYYRISSNFYNNNSEILNASINDGLSSDPTEGGVLQQNGSAILGVGGLANNRTGVSINSEFELGKLKFNFGQTIAKEIDRLTSAVTYGHTVNGLTQSEFYRWQYVSNVGPYGRWSKIFRGIYETVQIDNIKDGEIAFDKYFNSFDLQAKMEYVFNKRKSYFFYLGSFNSVQNKLSLFTVLNESAYIRQYVHQFENYTSLTDKTALTTYLGVERVIGNYQTDIDDMSFMPRNQTALGVGLGLDIALNQKTSLYLRHRYFTYEDVNFVLDNNSGHETTLEIKVNF
jgi:hypothetical protein